MSPIGNQPGGIDPIRIWKAPRFSGRSAPGARVEIRTVPPVGRTGGRSCQGVLRCSPWASVAASVSWAQARHEGASFEAADPGGSGGRRESSPRPASQLRIGGACAGQPALGRPEGLPVPLFRVSSATLEGVVACCASVDGRRGNARMAPRAFAQLTAWLGGPSRRHSGAYPGRGGDLLFLSAGGSARGGRGGGSEGLARQGRVDRKLRDALPEPPGRPGGGGRGELACGSRLG
jgi:hypothetical protein